MFERIRYFYFLSYTFTLPSYMHTNTIVSVLIGQCSDIISGTCKYMHTNTIVSVLIGQCSDIISGTCKCSVYGCVQVCVVLSVCIVLE